MNKYFLIISIVFAGLVSASTQIIKIEVEGYGENLQLAIDRGLTEAMGRINGRSIESEILSKNSEKLSTKNQTEEYLSSSDYQDQIKSKTVTWLRPLLTFLIQVIRVKTTRYFNALLCH